MAFDTIMVGVICLLLSWPVSAMSKYRGFTDAQKDAAATTTLDSRGYRLQNANSSQLGPGLGDSLSPAISDPANHTHAPSRILLGPPAPTLFPGTYTIKNAGRSCRPFASVNADCLNNAIDTWFSQDGSGRQIFSIQRKNSGIYPNEFTITVSGGRETCNRNLWSTQDCGGSEQPDLWLFEDGSGRQTFQIEPVPGVAGQFYIRVFRRFVGTPYSCSSYLTGADCSSSDPLIGYAPRDDGTGLQRWILTPTAPPPGSSIMVGAPILADGAYIISNLGANCKPTLTVQGGTSCFDAHLVGGSGTPTAFNIQRTSSSDEYIITAPLVGCSSLYLYTSPQACQDRVGLVPTARGGGLRFRIVPVPVNPELGQYYIVSAEQPVGCANYLTVPVCFNPSVDASLAYRYWDDNGFGELRWTFTPVPAMPASMLQTGDYRIVMSARVGCATQLIALQDHCYGGATIPNIPKPWMSTDASRSVWTVTQLPGSLDTYTIVDKARAASDPHCESFLSKVGSTCDSRLLDDVNFMGADDGTGAQRWTLKRVPRPGQDFNTFTIQSALATTCPSGSFLSVQPCGGADTPDLYFADDNSGRQQWTFYRV